MTKRYPGGYITKTPPTVSTTSAPGIWTMEQQAAYQKAGTWPFGGPFNYIEDVFSTYLYTGNGTTQTITNGIDLSGQGGMVWGKTRDAVVAFTITDTVRGVDKELFTNTTDAQVTRAAGTGSVYAFNSNGFSTSAVNGFINYSGYLEATWTFRKQPKFFDVVTYTGDGTGNRNIAHALGSVPGCMIHKTTSTTSNWQVYHRANTTPNANPESNTLRLNLTNASASSTAWINAPTATEFTVGSTLNASGETYVVYLFAHNAGGFGLTGTDNVISCGSFTTDGSGNATVNLGYEPQWVLVKSTTISGSNWILWDNMRGFGVTQNSQLYPNLSDAEVSSSAVRTVTATGLQFTNFYGGDTNSTFIYIAIRRGPMKTPTTGTSVFAPALASSSGTYTATSNFPVDWAIEGERAGSTKFYAGTRLTGDNTLQPNTTGAESAQSWGFANMTGYTLPGVVGDYSGFINWMMRRAPGFFDVVCYTGTGSATTQAHNLGVAPEMMILKKRSASGSEWPVYVAPLGATQGLYLGPYADPAITTSAYWNNTAPTSTVFTVGNASAANQSSATYVAYLFASCPGVSKVGSYSGTGGTQTISCGFAARFVLIKRADSTGNWWVWDTTRGMVAGTDPRLALNSTAAESNANWVYTDASGFQIVTTDATVNASGGSYIYLAIS